MARSAAICCVSVRPARCTRSSIFSAWSRAASARAKALRRFLPLPLGDELGLLPRDDLLHAVHLAFQEGGPLLIRQQLFLPDGGLSRRLNDLLPQTGGQLVGQARECSHRLIDFYQFLDDPLCRLGHIAAHDPAEIGPALIQCLDLFLQNLKLFEGILDLLLPGGGNFVLRFGLLLGCSGGPSGPAATPPP